MNPDFPAGSAPTVVLDTNAVLDWLVFGDLGVAALAAAVQAGAVRWLASPRMREELQRTLAYTTLARWNPDCERTLTQFDRWACTCAEPPPTRHGPLMCSDADDQVFIDLAIAQGTRWLVTHDRALLRLARAATRHGVRIVRPRDWTLNDRP